MILAPVASSPNVTTPPEVRESIELWGVWIPCDDPTGGRWIGTGGGQEGGRVFFVDRQAALDELIELANWAGVEGAEVVKVRIETA